ncbi:hypothetical protein SNE40_011248 [Patella caerulea]|uniref:Uncharacterized protein n=1 Tax=Patella caerulea TaxID=87958 RepID=A0AAN8JRH5_PATCE
MYIYYMSQQLEHWQLGATLKTVHGKLLKEHERMGSLSKSVDLAREVKRFHKQKSNYELNTLIKTIECEQKQSLREHKFNMQRFKKYHRTFQKNKTRQEILSSQNTETCSKENVRNIYTSVSQETAQTCRRHSLDCASITHFSSNRKKTITEPLLVIDYSTHQSTAFNEKSSIQDAKLEQTTRRVNKLPDIHKISERQRYVNEHPKFRTFLQMPRNSKVKVGYDYNGVSRRHSEPTVREYSLSHQQVQAKRRLSNPNHQSAIALPVHNAWNAILPPAVDEQTRITNNDYKKIPSQDTSTPTIDINETSDKEITGQGSRKAKVSKWELLRKLNSVKIETDTEERNVPNENKIFPKPKLSIFDVSLKVFPKLQNTIIEEEGENLKCDDSNLGIFLTSTSASEIRKEFFLRQQRKNTVKNLMKFSRGYKRTELVARLLEAEKLENTPVLIDSWQNILSKCRYLR